MFNAIYEIMCKNMVTPRQATDYNKIRCTGFECWVAMATHTHTQNK